MKPILVSLFGLLVMFAARALTMLAAREFQLNSADHYWAGIIACAVATLAMLALS